MDLLETTKRLIEFRTETGNEIEIKKCLDYIKSLFLNKNAKIKIYDRIQTAPVILLANTDNKDFDVLVVGHIDVVPAQDNMFIPVIENGKMFGRGTLDMKSFAAVSLKSLEYVLEKNLPIKLGVLLSSDEETGSKGLESFLEENPALKSKIVLDVDVAGDIGKIIAKCKNPVFVVLEAKGLEAHGSTPWDGIDANEKLIMTLVNIRKYYPYYSKETGKPENTWINTVHFAKINGGEVANVISNSAKAYLDFRLTEKTSLKDLQKVLEDCMIDGVSYEIISSSDAVVMDEQNPLINQYKSLAERILNKTVEFEYIGGATDARLFAKEGSIVIMHSGSGHGMHAKSEYVEIKTLEQLSDIQMRFLDKISELK